MPVRSRLRVWLLATLGAPVVAWAVFLVVGDWRAGVDPAERLAAGALERYGFAEPAVLLWLGTALLIVASIARRRLSAKP